MHLGIILLLYNYLSWYFTILKEQVTEDTQDTSSSKKKKKHKHGMVNGEGPDATPEEAAVPKKKKKKDKSE